MNKLSVNKNSIVLRKKRTKNTNWPTVMYTKTLMPVKIIICDKDKCLWTVLKKYEQRTENETKITKAERCGLPIKNNPQKKTKQQVIIISKSRL